MMFAIKLRSLFVIILITTCVEDCLGSIENRIDKAFTDESIAYRYYGHTPLKGPKLARKHRTSRATDVLEEEREVGGTYDSNCTISIDPKTKKMFTESILDGEYNFVRLRLEGVNISAVGRTIMPDHWIWTYKGKNGAHQLLALPQQSNYMSFGLAFSYAMPGLFYVKIVPKGDCKTLYVGDEETNVKIGSVLAEMTKDLAIKNSRYSHSYWCYTRNVPIEPRALLYACMHYVCPFQFTEYTCCRYSVNEGKENRHIVCGNDSYKFNTVWWVFPIVGGLICFAFFPLLLSYISFKMHKEGEHCSNALDLEIGPDPALYISVDVSHPVTFLSTIMEPVLLMCKCCKSKCSRFPWFPRVPLLFLLRSIPRLPIIWIPVFLTGVHIRLRFGHTNKYQGGLFQHQCVVGNFDAMLANLTYRIQCFLPYLGFLFFGHILILVPEDISSCLVKGICSPIKFKYAFLPTRSILEKMTGISVSSCTGFTKLYRYTLAQSYLVLNFKFWLSVFTLFKTRYAICDGNKCVICVKLCLLFFYLLGCLLELIWAFMYLTFPAVKWFFIALKAYIIATIKWAKATRNCAKSQNSYCRTETCWIWMKLKCLLAHLSCIVVAPIFCFVWYMYCLFFFDGFWFITKIIMFIYIGIIANPSVSNGWVLFVLISLYYLVDCLNEYGSRYKGLLQISIDAWKKHQSEITKQNGLKSDDLPQDHTRIEKELFHNIIEKHMPTRVNVFFTIFKFTLISIVIGISMHLLVSFDQLGNINQTINVFTAIFITSIPKLVELLFMKNRREMARKRLKSQVYKTVCKYRGINANYSIHTDVFQTL